MMSGLMGKVTGGGVGGYGGQQQGYQGQQGECSLSHSFSWLGSRGWSEARRRFSANPAKRARGGDEEEGWMGEKKIKGRVPRD